ncbi:MAG: DUF4492 domain-containing protein [Duncaniella sp.]|nr:DUF4492 domain-containing protein [Duncaniella sp.]MDE6859787.1 DUF4492 domain-containing protein [Duncaniella sp.]
MHPSSIQPDNSSTVRRIAGLPRRIFRFYMDGFRSMTIGKKLWILIIIKLIIIFCVFKLFFFPDILDRDYDNDVQRADAVRSTLLDR